MNIQTILKSTYNVPAGTKIAYVKDGLFGSRSFNSVGTVLHVDTCSGKDLLEAIKCAANHVAMVQAAIDDMQACIDAGPVEVA